MQDAVSNLLCLGHENALAVFEAASHQGRLPHAWLLTGPQGVGKRTVAYALIRRLFAEEGGHTISPEAPFIRRLVAGSHSDFFLLKEGKIEAIRALHAFLQKEPIEGKIRIALLPDVDTLTPSGTNALLKTLEEPALHTFFFLTAQRAGGLLPTLRSRCRILPLSPAPRETFPHFLNQLSARQGLPPATPERGLALWDITQGCLGNAIRLLHERDEEDPTFILKHKLSAALWPSNSPHFRLLLPLKTKEFWSKITPESLADTVLSWAQEHIVKTGIETPAESETLTPLRGWQRSPLAWAEIYARLQILLEEGCLFNADPLALAISAVAVMRGEL